MSEYYGSLAEANTYFGERLHTYDWDRSTPQDRLNAMREATELIDQFDYIGQKYVVQALLDNNPDTDWCVEANAALLRETELSQACEFPRGDSDVVPAEIEQACYLIAKALLSGRDPDIDFENLSISTDSYGGVKTVYQRDGNNQEHIAHLIPSPEAWTLIQPFLRERNLFDIKRVS